MSAHRPLARLCPQPGYHSAHDWPVEAHKIFNKILHYSTVLYVVARFVRNRRGWVPNSNTSPFVPPLGVSLPRTGMRKYRVFSRSIQRGSPWPIVIDLVVRAS